MGVVGGGGGWKECSNTITFSQQNHYKSSSSMEMETPKSFVTTVDLPTFFSLQKVFVVSDGIFDHTELTVRF